MATAIANANANGMDAVIQSNLDSGGFPSRCGFDANKKKEANSGGVIDSLVAHALLCPGTLR